MHNDRERGVLNCKGNESEWFVSVRKGPTYVYERKVALLTKHILMGYHTIVEWNPDRQTQRLHRTQRSPDQTTEV